MENKTRAEMLEALEDKNALTLVSIIEKYGMEPDDIRRLVEKTIGW